MTDFRNPLPEPVWVDSEALERTYIMWQVSEHLGVVVTDEDNDVPRVIFLPFIENPERVFWEGKDAREAGLTFATLKEVVAKLEAKIKEFE